MTAVLKILKQTSDEKKKLKKLFSFTAEIYKLNKFTSKSSELSFTTLETKLKLSSSIAESFDGKPFEQTAEQQSLQSKNRFLSSHFRGFVSSN